MNSVNDSQTNFLQPGGGIQSQNGLSQSANTTAVQSNGSPLSTSITGSGNQSVLSDSTIAAPSVNTQQNEPTKNNNNESSLPLIGIFLAIIIISFLAYRLLYVKKT